MAEQKKRRGCIVGFTYERNNSKIEVHGRLYKFDEIVTQMLVVLSYRYL